MSVCRSGDDGLYFGDGYNLNGQGDTEGPLLELIDYRRALTMGKKKKGGKKTKPTDCGGKKGK